MAGPATSWYRQSSTLSTMMSAAWRGQNTSPAAPMASTGIAICLSWGFNGSDRIPIIVRAALM